MTEDHLEQDIISRLESVGFTHLNGRDLIEENYRASFSDVLFRDVLFSALSRINPQFSPQHINDAVNRLTSFSSQDILTENIRFHEYLTSGIPVQVKEGNEFVTRNVSVMDVENTKNNVFHVVSQMTISGSRFTHRPDLLLYVNGLPIVVIELKNMTNEDTTIEDAYAQLQTYQANIPELFFTNGCCVISDGVNARVGTFSSSFDRYLAWKMVDLHQKVESNDFLQIDVMIRGLLTPKVLVDYVMHYATFPEKKYKVMPAYHQYRAIHLGIEAIEKSRDGRGGVIWHTQGSGKSYTMTFLASRLIQSTHLKNPTILIVTDRNDLDEQLYQTFSHSSDILRQIPIPVKTRKQLREVLNTTAGGIYFTTMQKFTTLDDEDRMPLLTERSNVVIMADEAHRTQYGLDATYSKVTQEIQFGYAKHIRDAFPNAVFVGFTGTPVETADKSTPAVFGDYIDQYTMTDAVKDGSTLKIFYESRIIRLDVDSDKLNEIDEYYGMKLAEGAPEYNVAKSKQESSKMAEITGSQKRLSQIATDFVSHFEERHDLTNGKAMIVATDRKAAVRLFEEIVKLRPQWQSDDLKQGVIKVVMTGDRTDEEMLRNHHTTKEERETLAARMRDVDDSLKVVIVVNMWLTGFDAPCVDTMYLDKDLKGHNLMQAIARVNRVFKGKSGGLVVDYFGIMASLKDALSQYSPSDKVQVGTDIEVALGEARTLLSQLDEHLRGVDYADFETNTYNAIARCAEYILDQSVDSDEFKQTFFTYVANLNSAVALTSGSLEDFEKKQAAFFKAIRNAMVKVQQSADHTVEAMNRNVNLMLNQSLASAQIINVNEILGIDNTNIDLFDEHFISQLMETERPNLAIELLKRLLEGEIRGFERTNFIKSKEYSEMIQILINRYHNRELSHAEVLDEMRKLSLELKSHHEFAQSLGLSEKELAFYDALTVFDDVKEMMQEPVLMELVQELTNIIQRSATIDWSERETTRARMRIEIKRLLKKYDYPPEKRDGAVDNVVKQAEKMAINLFE